MTAQIIVENSTDMGPTKRCDRCGAQAFGEVLLHSDSTLLFCVHHLTENWDALTENAATIVDHRGFLRTRETAR